MKKSTNRLAADADASGNDRDFLNDKSKGRGCFRQFMKHQANRLIRRSAKAQCVDPAASLPPAADGAEAGGGE